MSVSATLSGQIGNNLFQYAFARIIAQGLGFSLECKCVPLSPSHLGRTVVRSDAATLWDLADRFPNAPLNISGVRHSAPIDEVKLEVGGRGGGHLVDQAAILEDRSPRKLMLEGYFQRFEYYREHQASLRRWFAITGDTPRIEASPDDVLINIRRGLDFGTLGWTLPLSYYDRALERCGRHGQIFISGTGIDDLVREHFARFDPVYLTGSPIQDLSLFARFTRVILSNSTFAWWGAFLSEAREIYAPRTTKGSSVFGFTGYANVDLHMQDTRYVEIENQAAARFETLVVNQCPGQWPMTEILSSFSDGGGPELSPEGRAMLDWLAIQLQPVALHLLGRFQAREGNLLLRQLVNAGAIRLMGIYRG